MLTRLTLRSVLGPSLVALVLLAMTGLALQAATLLLGSAVMPSLGDTLRILLALLPAAMELALPIAFLVGLAVGYGRWHGDGTWTALRASGVAARGLLPAALLLGVVLAGALAWTTHQLAPEGRRGAARAVTRAASAAELVPGRFLSVGDTVLTEPPQGGLLLAHDEVRLYARRGALLPRDGGLLLELEGGQALGPWEHGLQLSFERASIPLPRAGGGRRVELAERSGAELAELVRRMDSKGKDASYEHAVLLKRSTLPLAALLLPLIALPLGLRWGGRPGGILGVAVGYWVLLRLGDAATSTLGPHLSACLPALGLALVAVVLWASWRDR
jgi:lipopolysaccharide export LptBFGC system permease protein LptF